MEVCNSTFCIGLILLNTIFFFCFAFFLSPVNCSIHPCSAAYDSECPILVICINGNILYTFEVLEEAIGKSEQVKIVRAGLWRLSRNAKAKGNYENNLLNYDTNTKKVLLIDRKTRGLKNL